MYPDTLVLNLDLFLNQVTPLSQLACLGITLVSIPALFAHQLTNIAHHGLLGNPYQVPYLVAWSGPS